MSEENIETNQKDIMKIFCCFFGRDLFVKHYTKLLSSRLLNKTSVSDKAEQDMIKFLQVECGHNFVQKMKTMFTDMDQSKQTLQNFQDHNGGKMVNEIEFSVQILTSGSWPFSGSDAPKCQLPAQMGSVRNRFFMYYANVFKNRQLVWFPDYASVTVETNYLQKKY